MKMTKEELRVVSTKRCKHGHTYLEHYNCYLEEVAPEKVGFLDIEASDLKANFGIMLSYCIKDANSDKIWFDTVNEKDLKGDLDKRLVTHCIEDMKRFDRVIGHYSTKYDIPFIRTRAIVWGLDFPRFGELNHTDTYYMAKRLLCLHSNRQNVVAEAIQGEDIKTRITPQYWIRALQGHKESIEYILDHNKKDVLQLEGNYNKLVQYSRKSIKSI